MSKDKVWPILSLLRRFFDELSEVADRVCEKLEVLNETPD